MIVLSKQDLTNAPEAVRRYAAVGIYVPERYWKLVAAGMSYSEIIDGEIVNLDAFNAGN